MSDPLQELCEKLVAEFSFETNTTGVKDSREPAMLIWTNIGNLTAGWRRTHDDCTVQWLENMKELFYATNEGNPIPNTLSLFEKYFEECMNFSQSLLSEKYKI